MLRDQPPPWPEGSSCQDGTLLQMRRCTAKHGSIPARPLSLLPYPWYELKTAATRSLWDGATLSIIRCFTASFQAANSAGSMGVSVSASASASVRDCLLLALGSVPRGECCSVPVAGFLAA